MELLYLITMIELSCGTVILPFDVACVNDFNGIVG